MLGPNTPVSPEQEEEVTQLARLAARNVLARRAAPPSHEGWANGTQDFAEKFRHFSCATPWFHKIWYTAFDDPDLTHIYIQAAREHAKTSAVLTYALKRLCENPHVRIGIISGSDPLAMAFLREIKYELESNQELIHLYNHDKPFVGDKWTEHELVLSTARDGPEGISGKDVSVFSVGRGSQISSRHCDILIADDVESADSVKSETVRKNTREWWAREVGPVLSPGGMFCVAGCLVTGTPVLMADGTWRAIEQVRVGESVWSVDEKGQSGSRTVEAVIDQGLADTFKVSFGTDHKGAKGAVVATANHPFLTAREGRLEWVRADELRKGDLVAEVKEIPGASQFDWVTDDFCWLLGYLFGDGWVTQDRSFIACALGTNEKTNERVMDALKDWFPTINFFRTPFGYIRAGVPRGSSYIGASKLIARALAEYGLGNKARGKRVPEWIFKSTPSQRRAFLKGFCEADGHNYNASGMKDGYAVEIANELLVRDLRRLALTCGVRTGVVSGRERINKAPHSREKTRVWSWRVSLNFGWADRMERGPKKTNTGTIAYQKEVRAAAILGPGFRLSSVLSVEPAAHEQVWDLTVCGTHAFVADGFVVHNTRKSYDDLYAHLIADPTWTVLDQAKSVFDADGNPIWPEMWDKAALLKRKAQLDAQDVLAWPQEYLNEPLPSETQMFHPELWPQYEAEPWIRARGMTVLQYWDLAISEKTTADFTVGVCVGVDDENNINLLEVRRGHWAFNRTLDEIGAMGHAWPTISRIGIEQVAYQAAAVQEALRRTMLPIVPMEPDRDKVTRARLLEARANAGKVYRPAKSAWWADAAQELLYFPAGAHDDVVDAMSGAALMAGWSADSVSWAYGVWTCQKCQHMFTWDPERPCPKCGTKAPLTFANPEMESYGRLLEDQGEAATTEPIPVYELPPPVSFPLPPSPNVPPGGRLYDLEVVLSGTDEVAIATLRSAVEQMGTSLVERDGHYFVPTSNANRMRPLLAQQGYVQSVI